MDKYIKKYGVLAIVAGIGVWYILRKVGNVAEAAIDEMIEKRNEFIDG